MDARELLRRYLEQRREMGERELVLDDMSVEDVMRLVGARPGGKPAPRTAAPTRAVEESAGPALREESRPRSDDVPDREVERAATPRDVQLPEDADWRTILESTGAAPGRSRDAVGEPPAASTPAVPDDVAQIRDAAAPTSEHVVEPARGPIDVGAPDGIVVGGNAGELFGGPISQLATLEEIAETVQRCTRCPLHQTAKRGVPGEGNPNADLVCVGEAPGATEDETGRPFVGEAGQLLTKILAAIKLAREDVFICNVLKHRPPGNRNPLPNEVAACSPYLVRQLELVRPKVIVAFGTFAAQTLLDTKLSIGKLRGQVHRYHGIPLVVTYHPAALLRNPAWKRPTWEDVQLARRILDSASGA